MLDVARHFFAVDDVKRYIDDIALLKINYLHLHLTDDQGWRLQIDSWPLLTEVGSRYEVGTAPGRSAAASTRRTTTARSSTTRRAGSSRSSPRSTCPATPTRRSPRTPN